MVEKMTISLRGCSCSGWSWHDKFKSTSRDCWGQHMKLGCVRGMSARARWGREFGGIDRPFRLRSNPHDRSCVPLDWAPSRNPGADTPAPAWSGYHQGRGGMRKTPFRAVLTLLMQPRSVDTFGVSFVIRPTCNASANSSPLA